MSDKIKFIPGVGYALRLRTGEWVTENNGQRHDDINVFFGVIDVGHIRYAMEDPEQPERWEIKADLDLMAEVDDEVFAEVAPNHYEQVQAIPESQIEEMNRRVWRKFSRRQS